MSAIGAGDFVEYVGPPVVYRLCRGREIPVGAHVRGSIHRVLAVDEVPSSRCACRGMLSLHIAGDSHPWCACMWRPVYRPTHSAFVADLALAAGAAPAERKVTA